MERTGGWSRRFSLEPPRWGSTTILVVRCYHYETRSTTPMHDSQTGKPRPRVAHRTAPDGPARPAGPAVGVENPVGAAPRTADLRRAAGAMRRDVAQRAESAYRRAARNGQRRARRRRLSPDGGRQRPARFDSTARRLGQTMGPAAWLNGSLVLVLHPHPYPLPQPSGR